MLPFMEDLTVVKLHVQAPTELVFLCGGPYTDISEPNTVSMRDAFRKIVSNPSLGSRDVVLAEDFTKLSVFASCYDNILDFETELAQIAELIILFCESAGSFTELGSFSSIPEISSRLLVVIRDFHWKEESFIVLGPLAFLKKNYQNSVFVIEDDVIGIYQNSTKRINLERFKLALDEPIRVRLAGEKEPSTFDSTRSGHLIKLIVGLVQEYGALDFDEIFEALDFLSVKLDEKQLKAYLLCASTVGWIEKKTKGFREFFVALAHKPATHFVAKDDSLIRNPIRRRLMIRQHWEERDPSRFRAISPEISL